MTNPPKSAAQRDKMSRKRKLRSMSKNERDKTTTTKNQPVINVTEEKRRLNQ